MKIYVDNYPLQKLAGVMPHLDKYKTGSNTFVKLYSPTSGIYQIENSRAYKLYPPLIANSSITHLYNGFSIIIQREECIKEEVSSQLPVQCLLVQETTVKYALNPIDPMVFLMVEGVLHSQSQSQLTNFYFQTNGICEGINNAQFQQEFSGLLSLLK
jgi:hypothetical protein